MPSLHPSDCPAWEYNQLPDHAGLLKTRTKSFLIGLRTGQVDTRASTTDSRAHHRDFFAGLTPPNHTYFAGNYRGESFRCLKYYEVRVPSDPRVGYPAPGVEPALQDLRSVIESGLAALDTAAVLPLAVLSDEDKLLYVVAFACRVFEIFLRIHPYANGNGHIGRFIIWCVLGRYGYWPVRFPIEPRPPDPPYCDLIAQHRNGNCGPLEAFVLSCIANRY